MRRRQNISKCELSESNLKDPLEGNTIVHRYKWVYQLAGCFIFLFIQMDYRLICVDQREMLYPKSLYVVFETRNSTFQPLQWDYGFWSSCAALTCMFEQGYGR